MQDSFKYKGMRRKLINELREKGISDETILNAFDVIPRHYFLDNAFAEQAYSNMPFQIGAGQTISHPYTVAFQTQLLDIKKGEKILEIGSGSGFQTSVLCEMGAKVFSIERHKSLHLKAKQIVQFLNYNARLSFGDGYKGLPSFAPFDKIIITCGAPDIPQDLVDQLKVGGIMIIPIGEGKEQQMLRITKVSDTEIAQEEFGVFSFVPMLESKVR
jgi:protein-L-isoaspartate(D-aspartate) O-methyltransferase